MKNYQTCEGEFAAVDTWYALTALGGSAPGYRSPAQTRKISKVIGAFATDGAANAAAQYFVRISGPHIKGSHTLVLGSSTVDGTPAEARNDPAFTVETDIECNGEGVVTVEVMVNYDTGTPTGGVTLEFSS